MSNPVVVIATHMRKVITSRTIEQLQKGSVVPHIILVCSRYDEYQYYSEKFEQLTVIINRNEPLGEKWHVGARCAAKHFKADPLIILGSDDLLNTQYVQDISNMMRRFKVDFIGINQWWLLDEKTDTLYLMEYAKKDFPLGGGRAYSQKLLQQLDFTVFDAKKFKHLDDFGWHAAKNSGLPYMMLQEATTKGLHIVSIKGDWQTMNSAEAILKAKSCIIVNQFENGQMKLNTTL